MNDKEFEAEFGNIEKVVKMPVPPTWEEFLKEQYFEVVTIENKLILSYFISKDEIVLYHKWGCGFILELPNTEENYIKALRKMVELFKEEV